MDKAIFVLAITGGIAAIGCGVLQAIHHDFMLAAFGVTGGAIIATLGCLGLFRPVRS